MDDCEEVTHCIGKIHSHFYTVEEVLEFLDNLFNDEVLIWEANDGKRGGWRLLEKEGIQAMPNARNYLWSGPISSSDPGYTNVS